MNYVRLNEGGMLYKGLATPTNLMKCLWHPLKKKGMSFKGEASVRSSREVYEQGQGACG
jgi:hypothetical protein